HEAYDLMAKAWTEPDPFEWHGEHYSYDCVSILPRPLQTPHPSMWTTCSSEESLQWAASRHFKLVAPGTVTQTSDIINYYRDYAQNHCGWTPTSADFGMAREFFIAPTRARVDAELANLGDNNEENSVNPRFRVPALTALLREQWDTR